MFENLRFVAGLKSLPGLKRKSLEDLNKGDLGSLITIFPANTNLNPVMSFKRNRLMSYRTGNREDENMENDSMDVSRCNGTLNASTRSPCAIEGCLSEGFAGLFSTRSCLQFKPDRRVSFAQRQRPRPSNAENVLQRLI